MQQERVIRPEKQETVGKLVDRLTTAKSVFLTDFSGLSVEAITNLRRNFRKSNVDYIVGKNTLMRIAAEKAGYKDMIPHLQGPTAVAFGMKDAGAPAKVILDFLKNNPKPTIKAFIFEGQYFDANKAEAIAKLPSRQELLAQLLSTLNAPLYGLVNSLQGILRNFAYVLQAVADKKQSAEADTK
jgi:large subunit ribosomal protein L10